MEQLRIAFIDGAMEKLEGDIRLANEPDRRVAVPWRAHRKAWLLRELRGQVIIEWLPPAAYTDTATTRVWAVAVFQP